MNFMFATHWILAVAVLLGFAHFLEPAYRLMGRSVPQPYAKRLIRGTIQCGFLVWLAVLLTLKF
jgi:hypothetical protein